MGYTSTITEFQWLQFLGKLKSLKPATESGKKLEETQPEFDKFFVLTIHDFEHCVYVVDVSCNSNVHKYPIPSLEPILRFGFLRGHSVFSIVGTKLYGFGGEEHNKTRVKFSKKMSFYDLSLALSPGPTINLSNQEDEELKVDQKVKGNEGVTGGVKGDKEVEAAKVVDDLENGPDMAAGKICPVSVVIGFKICVFSSLLYLNREGRLGGYYESCLRPNFEVYDTSKGSWFELPEPFDKLDPEITVVVRSYCVHQSCFIIQTDLGFYGINIDNPYLKWVKMVGSESIREFPFKGMWMKVGKQLCNPFQVVRRGDLKSYRIALKDSTERDSLIERYPTGVLFSRGQNNGCIDLLSVRGGFPYHYTRKYMQVPYLLVDIVKFDAEALTKLGSDLSIWNVQGFRSFTFSLNSTPSDYMKVIGCFPLKGTDTSIGRDASKDYISEKIKDGQQWVDISDKVTSGFGEYSFDFDTSHTEGANGNGYLGRRHQAKSSITNGLAVGSSSRLQQVLRSLLV